MASNNIIEKYAVKPPLKDKFFMMIPQSTVLHTEIGSEPLHISIWDYNISPDGKHYFSICAEGDVTEYLRLYEYFPETGEVELKFRLEDVIITYPRAIRPSKIHSSISFMPDGKLIMATHTTACAPGHPRWLPFAYFSHIWEGYQGSNIIIYDPETGKVEDLGIPVMRESIYGGIYEESTNSFYFSTYHRGHVYRFDLDNRHVTDFGQATEFGTWRFIKGMDENLYTTTATGRFVRINIKKQCIEDIKTDFPLTPRLIKSGTNNKLMHYAHSKDGKMYFTSLSCDKLMTYDYSSEKIKVVTSLVPESLNSDHLMFRCMGMDIDKYGYLWCVCNAIGFGSYLIRYDTNNGDKVENMGLLGSRSRVINASYSAFIRDDVLYVSDTNRSLVDPAAILRVKLNDVRTSKERVMTIDPIIYMKMKGGDRKYKELTGRSILKDASKYYVINEKNADKRMGEAFSRTLPENTDDETKVRFYGDNAMNATSLPSVRRWVSKLWKEVGYDNSYVNEVSFDENADVTAICGKGPYFKLTIRDGVIKNKEENIDYTPRDTTQIAEKYKNLPIPYQAERRHLAYVNAECKLGDGRTLIGTRDSMLAIVDCDNNIFSLGSVCAAGAVHDMACSPDGAHVVGVAGDECDIGMVFTFDLKHGVTLHGRLFFHDIESIGLIGASNEPYCVAYAPDGKSVAIGVRDKQGCVYRFYFKV